VATAEDLRVGRAQVAAVGVAPAVLEYIVALCRATREVPSVEVGVSPRGATALLHASKAWAWLSGRDWVSPDEVKAIAVPTLRHRLVVRPELELEGTTADGILTGLLATVPAPR
jgi:MoxR-like ATPase